MRQKSHIDNMLPLARLEYEPKSGAIFVYLFKTEESDLQVTEDWTEIHLQIGIEAMTEIGGKGERIKHFRY